MDSKIISVAMRFLKQDNELFVSVIDLVNVLSNPDVTKEMLLEKMIKTVGEEVKQYE